MPSFVAGSTGSLLRVTVLAPAPLPLGVIRVNLIEGTYLTPATDPRRIVPTPGVTLGFVPGPVGIYTVEVLPDSPLLLRNYENVLLNPGDALDYRVTLSKASGSANITVDGRSTVVYPPGTVLSSVRVTGSDGTDYGTQSSMNRAFRAEYPVLPVGTYTAYAASLGSPPATASFEVNATLNTGISIQVNA